LTTSVPEEELVTCLEKGKKWKGSWERVRSRLSGETYGQRQQFAQQKLMCSVL
jgi:stalled ribosome alternative rescue factor ArfA